MKTNSNDANRETVMRERLFRNFPNLGPASEFINKRILALFRVRAISNSLPEDPLFRSSI